MVRWVAMVCAMALLVAGSSGGAAQDTPVSEDFRSQSVLRQNFSSYPTGWWREGSIHGPWKVSYDSNPCGRVGIVKLGSGRKVYRANLSGCSGLRATKVRSLKSYPANINLRVEFRVVKKTRPNKKAWHTAWIGWAHKRDNRWNNLLLKSSGWEIGKFSRGCPDRGSGRNQCYFRTGMKPKFSNGKWHTARIEQRRKPGGVKITAYGDGKKLATVYNIQGRANKSGNVLLYNEGSIVDFRRVEVVPV